MKAACSEVH